MERGNRIDPDATLKGAFITSEPLHNIADIKQGCEYEEQKVEIFLDD